MQSYDVLVLGGGTAGSAAAREAQKAGCKTAMFNDGELGGLCILRGCMPTKTMLHAAHLLHDAGHHGTPGVGQSDLEIDFPAIMANKDAKVARFKRAKLNAVEAGGYEVVDARARFSGPDTVEAGGETYRFTKGAVIAVGSVVTTPPIPGLDTVPWWDSDDLMQLESQPDSVIVFGTGAIGLEFAQFFARIGTDTQLVSRRPIMIDIGPDLSQEVVRMLADEPNMTPHSHKTPVAVRKGGKGVEVDLEWDGKQKTITAQHLIVATGRRPAIDDLNLQAAGVELDGKHIKSAGNMQTSNPKVFVAGDATGDRLLLHTANWEGVAAGKGAAQIEGTHEVERRLHVTVSFTDPPVATVGMNLHEAEAKGIPAIEATAKVPETGRAITMDARHGVIHLVACQKTGEVLGAQIFGPRADDMVHVISSIMYFHGTVAQMLEMPWYHPTLTEVFLSLARELAGKVG